MCTEKHFFLYDECPNNNTCFNFIKYIEIFNYISKSLFQIYIFKVLKVNIDKTDNVFFHIA